MAVVLLTLRLLMVLTVVCSMADAMKCTECTRGVCDSRCTQDSRGTHYCCPQGYVVMWTGNEKHCKCKHTSRDDTKLKTRDGGLNGSNNSTSPREEGRSAENVTMDGLDNTSSGPRNNNSTSPRNNNSNTAASVAGSVVGTLVFLVIGGAVAAAAVYVVFKYRRRMTETLEPWPDTAKSTDGGIHNPTYGAEDFLASPPSSPTQPPPVYEEVQSPDSETDCEPEKVFHNPLYGDVTYLPMDEDNTPPNEINHTSVYAMSSQRGGTNKPAQRTQCRVRFKDEATVLNESGDSSTMDYSTLDPTTQYASLEPYVGQSDAGDVVERAEVENHDPNDYSHLKH